MSYHHIAIRGRHGGQLIVNNFWYSLADPEPLLPEEQDALLLSFRAAVADTWRGFQSVNLHQDGLVLQSYTGAWDRAPFLPRELVLNRDCLVNLEAAPPNTSLTLSARVVPRFPIPVGCPPVVRGYWAVSSMDRATVRGTGLWDAGFLSSAALTNLRAACKSTLGISGRVALFLPIKVGKANGAGARAVADIVDVIARPEISVRSSRKVGRGA
jgi:hypothetical protein